MTSAEALSVLLDLAGTNGWIGAVVFFRVAGAMALLPAFGEKLVPVRVKIALAIAFTAIITPAVAPGIPAPESRPWISILLAETVCGLMLGFSVRLMVWLLQIAGTMAAQATSLSQLLGAEAVDPQPAIAQLLFVAGLAVAAAAGLHVRIAEALILSYDTLPAGLMPDPGDTARWSIARIGQVFATAFSFAAPFLIASLVYNVALGVINRAMPQLMVAFVGAPALTAGGLVLLMLAAPLILPVWADALSALLAAPFAVAP